MEKTGLVKLTQSAVDHMTKLIDEQGKPIVRLEVKGGGCAGFQYEWSMTENLEEKDEVVIEAKEILDVKDVIVSITLVEDLRIQKD